jgi:hypothetical protein
MREELTMSELDDQRVELLPARETLYVHGHVNIWAYNQALAFNVQSFQSDAEAWASQSISVG